MSNLPPQAAKVMIDPDTGAPFVVAGSNDTTPQQLAVLAADASGNVTGLVGPGGESIPLAGAQFPLPLVEGAGVNNYTAQVDLVNTQSIDTESGDFRLCSGGSGTAFTDWNSNVINDHITNFGINFGYGDSTFRKDTTKPSFGVCWESKYWLPGSRNVYATEFGFRGRTQGGNERRLFDAYLPWDGLEYESNWNSAIFQLGHPVTSNGAMGFQRVKFDLWPNNLIRLIGIAATGTAAGATTNSVGYAAGVSQVTLAATGSGSLPQDCLFQFDGTGTVYAVETTVANVGAGGTLTFSPALTSPLSAAAHTVVRASVAPPSIAYQSNNTPFVRQRNAAGTSDIALPYLNASDNVVSDVPFAPLNVNTPFTVKGPTGYSGQHISRVIDSTGAELFGVGGTPGGNTTWLGHGWFGSQTSEAVGPGIELRSTQSGTKTFSLNLGGDANLVLRQNTSGAGNAFLDIQNNLYIRNWAAGGAALLTLNPTKAQFNQPVALRSYANVAALPSASGAGAGSLVHVVSTTTPGGACIAASDGTNWKVVVALGSAATVA